MTAQPFHACATLALKGKLLDARVTLSAGVRHAGKFYRPGTTVTALDQDFRVRLGPRRPFQFGQRVRS